MHNNLFKKTGVCVIENKLNYEDTLLYCEIQFHHNLSSSQAIFIQRVSNLAGFN